ncbi:MAG: YncE family protein [Gemmatirosa sp.]
MSHRRLLRAAVGLLVVGCGGGESTAAPPEPTPATPNPAPVLLVAAPEQVAVGAGTTVVTLTGEGFVQASRARVNDQDRATTYVSGTQLRVELTARDVESAGERRVVVYTPPPGGGLSGAMPVSIAQPAPVVASITPNTVEVGAASWLFVVHGAGFSSASTLTWNDVPITPTSVGPTELQFRASGALLQSAAIARVAVTNPAPGGGRSGIVEVTIGYPVPVVVTAGPEALITNVAATITVEGSRFVRGSVVRWNGADRPTAFVSATRLTATLEPADVSVEGRGVITVVNPSPGGGTSNQTTLPIRNPPPRVTSFAPAQLPVGAREVTVRGVNFTATSDVTWNGTSRPVRLVDASTLVVTLRADDTVRPGGARVVVTNAGSSGASESVVLPIVATAVGAPTVLTVPLRITHMVADPTRDVLYASVPSADERYGNSVVTIDATTGQVRWSTFVGSEPSQLAVSDDGRFLYVGLAASPYAVRIDLQANTEDLRFSLGPGSQGATRFVEDIEVLPGDGRTVVITHRRWNQPGFNSRHEGIAVYDDGERRPTQSLGTSGNNRLARGAGALSVVAYNQESTEFGLRRFVITPTGIVQELIREQLFTGFATDIEADGGRIYGTNGAVVDASAMTVLGTFLTSGLVRPDERNGRVHFFSAGVLATYNYFNFSRMGAMPVAAPGSTVLVRWGRDGVALGGGAQIVIVRSPIIGG